MKGRHTPIEERGEVLISVPNTWSPWPRTTFQRQSVVMEQSATIDSGLLLTFHIPKRDQVSPFSSVIRRCPFRPSADVCVELYICFRYKLCKMPRNCVMVYSTIILTFFSARCYASAACVVMRCLCLGVCVCVCVCVSRSRVASKRINISSKYFHNRVATPF